METQVLTLIMHRAYQGLRLTKKNPFKFDPQPEPGCGFFIS